MFARKVFYGLVVMVVVVALAMGGLAVALAAGPGSAQPAAAQTAPQTAARSITVVGTGKVSGKPDIARVTVGIETQPPLLQDAVDENKAKMSGLLDTLKSLAWPIRIFAPATTASTPSGFRRLLPARKPLPPSLSTMSRIRLR